MTSLLKKWKLRTLLDSFIALVKMDSINTKVLLLILVFILEEGVHFPREEKKKIGILARMGS